MSRVERFAPVAGAARSRALADGRDGLRRSLTARFWLRFHASLIVSGTFATGFLANAAMLQWPVHSVGLRWPLAVLAGYAAFFALVRLWLAYVGVKPLFADRGSRWTDGVDLPSGGRGGGGGSFGGGGGSSGGGGASASFDAAPSAGVSQVASTSSSAGRGANVGIALDGVGDVDGDGVLVIVLGLIALALIAALVGGAVHLVWIAPEMLSDAAFGAMLAAGALPGLRRIGEPDWNGRVFRATLPVLAAVMAVTLVAAWAFTHWFPGLRTLGEAWLMLS
jgi:hypothetical protein